ncbi:MAG: hypothetical protein LBI45_04135 [Bacteroidales bacterium]|jgi:nitrate reductase gamma subunit|nr:hypothetical protein [Bacteroidales bacterium]
MNLFIYASYIALFLCFTLCLIHFIKLVRLGTPKDLSEPAGDITAGIIYSNTGAMSPKNKESAYKHLPTYTAGIVFHLGSFLALICYLLLIFDSVWFFFFRNITVSALIAVAIWVSSFCATGLLIKRLTSKKLRFISNLDDYFSVILVILFQFSSAILFTTFVFHDYFHNFFSHNFHGRIICIYYLLSALLFLYLPFGKLKHTVYYFAARYHLGFFYGIRGTWPPK